MRHRVYGKHLGRNKDQRQALFKGLVYSLFSHGTIQTSEAKAKAIKGLVDKIINSAKDKQSLIPRKLGIKNTQRKIKSFLTDKEIRERLIKEIVPKLGTRTSGYTRLVKIGTRLGDQTRMVRMSLIGAEQLKPIEKGSRVPARGEARQRRQGLGDSKKQVQIKEQKEKKSIFLRKGRAGRSVRTTTSRRRVTSRSSK